jgi:LysM repeat protein
METHGSCVVNQKSRHLVLVFPCLFLLSGCAGTLLGNLFKPAGVNSDESVAVDSVETLSWTNEAPEMAEVALEYKGKAIPATKFDLPVEMNKTVEKWIDYFTGKGRGHFEKYLERSEYFIPFLKPILRNAKAPEDLVYLAMIESGFNNNARSNARAVGAWQFIPATGRRYGLDVNWWVDERRDVEKSTIAAVQYLKELNAMFGSWHLAAAAYNAGEAKIQRAIGKYKTKDFWELTEKKRKYLKPETKNYVPKLFAAAIICKNRKFFGFEEKLSGVKRVSAAIVAAKAEEKDEIGRLPDQLDSDKTETPSQSQPENLVELTRDSPMEPDEAARLAPDSMEAMLRSMSAPVRTPHVNVKGEVNGDVLTEVEIPSPADLFKVASAAGLSYMEFKSMNPELSRWVTPPDTKTYRVRMPLSHKEGFIKKYFDSSFQKEVTFLVYKARKGDTPKKVAKRFGISPDPLLDMNEVRSAGMSFLPGTLVELPIPSDFVRSLASLKTLELLDPVYPKRHRSKRARFRKRAKQSNSSEARLDGQSRRSRL